MENNLIVFDDVQDLRQIEKSKAEQIKNVFVPMTKMLHEFEAMYDNIIEESKKEITKDLIKEAKKLRLEIARIRIDTEKERKAQKEEYLRAGKAIDGVANILKWAVTEKEEKLEEIERYYERIESERLQKIQTERESELRKYVDINYPVGKLSEMAEDVWNIYIAGKRIEYNDRIIAEKRAEEERIAREKREREENERIRIENEKLREQQEKIRLENERIKKEQEKKEAEYRLAQKKLIEENNRKIAEEKRIAEEKIRRMKEEKEAEDKKRIEEENAKKEYQENIHLQADEIQKKELINDFKEIQSKYNFKSAKMKYVYNQINMLSANALILLGDE